MIRVLVNGAAGRMGSEVVRSVLAEDGLELCGGVDIGAAGKDLGEVSGIGHNGMTIDKTLEEAFAQKVPAVVVVKVDYSENMKLSAHLKEIML